MTALPRAMLGLRDLIKPEHLQATQQRLQGLMAGLEPRRVLPAPAPAASVALARPRTILERLAAALGVEEVRLPFAIGVWAKATPDQRRLIGLTVRRKPYLIATLNAAHRWNLDGTPAEGIAGVITDEHRAHAKARLAVLDAPKEKQP